MERPTLDTVAAAAGVSRMTVSNAYNRPDQLSAATRERVLAVAAELGYAGPDPAGRSLRRGTSGAVGVVLTESLSYAFTDPGLVSFLRGVADTLTEAGRSLLLLPTHADGGGDLVRDALVDAFVVCAVADDDPALAAVLGRGLPVVTVGSPRLKGRPFLGIDNAAAAGLAAEHLVGLGHRRLGVVGLPPRLPLDDGPVVDARPGFARRVSGFVAAAERSGAAAGSVAVVQASTNSSDAGAQGARELLSVRRHPTAVFAVSDVLALGVLRAASELGLAVPGDLSVVGFDGIEEGAHSAPPLTTISQDLRGQGRRAAAAALAAAAGGTVRPRQARPELTVRASTAPPRRP